LVKVEMSLLKMEWLLVSRDGLSCASGVSGLIVSRRSEACFGYFWLALKLSLMPLTIKSMVCQR
jgi:hypothetical protein